MSIEAIILFSSYIGIFILMILVGIFGFFPPSKIIYVVAGYFVSTGNLTLLGVVLSGGFGHTIGNYVQYEIAKRKGISFLKKVKFYNEKEIKKLVVIFKRKGIWFLFIGKLLDPIKLVICLCAGLIKTPLKYFFPIVLLASLIWALGLTFIGFYFGKSFENFGYMSAIVLVLGSIVIFSVYKYMNSPKVLEEIEKLK